MESKECPFGGLPCDEKRCAWWIEEKGRCAVAAIAVSLVGIHEVYELDRATSIGSGDDR